MRKISLLFVFTLFAIIAYAQPVNDSIVNAIPMPTVFTATTTVDATYNYPIHCDGHANPKDIWYSFSTGAVAENFIITTRNTLAEEGGNAGSVIEIFEFDGTTLTSVYCYAGWNAYTRIVLLPINTDYLVRFHRSWNGALGEKSVTSEVKAFFAAPVSNDTPSTAIDITGGSSDGNLELATSSGEANPTSCFPSWYDTNDMWYEVSSEPGYDLTVTVDGFVFPNGAGGAHFGVYVYKEDLMTELACAGGGWTGTASVLQATFNTSSFKGEDFSTSRTPSIFKIRVMSQGIYKPSFDMDKSTVLPIELSSFTGEMKHNSNMLKWETASEINTDFIEVQSSDDAVNWSTIGRKSAKGNSSTNESYSFEDTNPFKLTYYRLNTIDRDNTSKYSKVINVERNEIVKEMIILPNPASTLIQMKSMASKDGNGLVSITDLTGKVMIMKKLELKKGVNSFDFNIEELPAGIYLFSLIEENGTAVRKMIKQ